MKNKKSLLLVTVCLAISILAFGGGIAQAATICVNPGGTGGCLSTIQAAVDAASAGQTIMVMPGTYTGGVMINKPRLRLIGQSIPGLVKVVGPAATTSNRRKPSVQGPVGDPEKPDLHLMGLFPTTGQDLGLYGFAISANHVLIQGFDISGFDGEHDTAGILVGGQFIGDTAHHANGATIKSNWIHNNGIGIYLWQSNNNTVQDNFVYNNKDFDGVQGIGILSFSGFGDADVIQANQSVHSGKNNHIVHNQVYDNDREAIFAGACTEVAFGCLGPKGVHANIGGTFIEQNTARGNGADASLAGANQTEAIGVLDARGAAITSNVLTDNAAHGIFLNFSGHALVDQNNVRRNDTAAQAYPGIRVNRTHLVTVSHNVTIRNAFGIYVTLSNVDAFTNNAASNNTMFDLDWDKLGTQTFASNTCGTARPSKTRWDCQ